MRTILLTTTILLGTWINMAQDPQRFAQEVSDLTAQHPAVEWEAQNPVVFTGSSSIRMWHKLDSIFPTKPIINTGFGGSQASDLMAYLNELVLDFSPQQVFIYEGDNDIQAGKKVKQVKKDLIALCEEIRDAQPNTPIVIISAKPSLARWKLKGQYKRLNRKMKRYCRKNSELEFANVWDTMLVDKKPDPSIFLEDGLHMNAKGYALWQAVIEPYITQLK